MQQPLLALPILARVRQTLSAVAAASILGMLAIPPPAGAVEETANQGAVRAVLTYETTEAAPPRHLGITILRRGTTPRQRTFEPFGQPETKPAAEEGDIRLLDLEGTGEFQVLVDLANGGNDCCRYTRVYSYQAASNSYRALTFAWRSWDEPEWRELQHNGKVEAIDGDGRFYFAFACKACAPLPPMVWAFRLTCFVHSCVESCAYSREDGAVSACRHAASTLLVRDSENVCPPDAS